MRRFSPCLNITYIVFQIIILILCLYFCFTNILKFNEQNLDRNVIHMEEINVEVVLYIFVYLEVIWKIIFFKNIENSSLYKLTFTLDLLFLITFSVTLYMVKINPFEIETFLLEGFSVIFRAINLIIRLISLIFYTY